MTARVTSPDQLAPGDVLLTRSENCWSRLIRLGASLEDRPDVWNHAVIVSHVDEAGVRWGAEGRAGGVGWVDLAVYTADRWTISNAAQPKTDAQRALVVAGAKAMIGVNYDWPAIVIDALQAVAPLWRYPSGRWGKGVPGQVVCSSLADLLYRDAGLAGPNIGRWCTPADWAAFILRKQWELV